MVILDFDDDKKRISLGLKQLTPHPWDVLPEGLAEGSVVKGKVVNIEDYGAFLEIMPGVEGLVHVSELGADYFQFDNIKHQMLGERTGQRDDGGVAFIEREARGGEPDAWKAAQKLDAMLEDSKVRSLLQRWMSDYRRALRTERMLP